MKLSSSRGALQSEWYFDPLLPVLVANRTGIVFGAIKAT